MVEKPSPEPYSKGPQFPPKEFPKAERFFHRKGSLANVSNPSDIIQCYIFWNIKYISYKVKKYKNNIKNTELNKRKMYYQWLVLPENSYLNINVICDLINKPRLTNTHS